jgi:hypothetical protein
MLRLLKERLFHSAREADMKRFLALTVFMVILICPVKAVKGSITDVYTEPLEPTDIEVITIVVSGLEGSGAVVITDSNFQREDSSLGLDIFITLGYYGVITPWSHSEVIGMLPANDYDLTVSTHYIGAYVGTDIYSTSFTVVPEPATLLLLTMGVVWIRVSKCKLCHKS